jgi:GT2 family glycosyltransferase
VVFPPDTAASADETDLEVHEAVAAPPAVAVVVAHDPGPWFEECLTSIAAQDYPSLSVLVIDAGSEVDPTPRVAAVLPSAYVLRVAGNPGYGPASNEVLTVVEGASFLLLCHDDVALAPDAVRTMVEEAFRSNAGVVAPKLVAWDDTSHLLQVGLSVDKTGVPVPMIEPGELDQEQHDAVRDVFCAPGGCTLVRADLFAALGGFDRAIDFLGEDVDLSWRAQVAGARVVVAPAAVVRHVEDLASRRGSDDNRRLQARHRLRTVLICYSPVHLVRVLPQAIVVSFFEALYALLAGRVGHARDVAGAWVWNLKRLSEVRAARAQLRRVRQLPDSEVRKLQVRGSARFSAFLRGQIGGGDDRLKSVSNAGRELAGSFRSGERRAQLATWGVAALVLLFGSRLLLTGHLPAFGDLPAYPSSPRDMLSSWASGWRSAGLGSESPAPTAYAFLGTAGLLVLASMDLLRRVLLLVPLAAGTVGAWRLVRDTGSSRSRLAGLVTYLAIPLPYNAIATGRWGGLLIWSAAPWLVRAIATAGGDAPFGERRVTRRRAVVALGLVLALLAAFVPFVLAIALLIALCLAVGGVVAGRVAGASRMVGTTIVASLIAVVLHLPWSLDFLLPGAEWSTFGGVRSASHLDIGQLLRFQTGPIGAGPLGYAVLVAAALPLLIGREWRVGWAVRGWMLALACWTVAWMGEQSWFHLGLGPREALLAPAAAGLALSVALGMTAFELDLRGYRFGWRQVASVVAATSLAVALLPVIGGSFDGRWGAPEKGFEASLGFLSSDAAAVGSFRVLWLGDPELMPLAGWRLRDGLAYGSTDQGLPTVADRWVGTSEDPTGLLGDALGLAIRRETSRLGRLLAPMGVRYVVVVEAAAPGEPIHPAPADLVRTLGEQLDLEQVPVDATLHVYRNASWAPTRATLPAGAAESSGGSDAFRSAIATDLRGATPALRDGLGYAAARGDVANGDDIYLAAGTSTHWSLSVGGHNVPRRTAFGWANLFAADRTGRATLQFNTPIQRRLLLAGQVALWAAAVIVLIRLRRRERDAA